MKNLFSLSALFNSSSLKDSSSDSNVSQDSFREVRNLLIMARRDEIWAGKY